MAKEKKRSEYISEFLNFIDRTKKEYDFAVMNLNTQDNLTQDLLHKLELEHLDRNDRAKLATRLKKNRQERRRQKDCIQETEEIVKYFNENKKAIELLKQVLGKVRKTEEYHSRRTYTPKVKD